MVDYTLSKGQHASPEEGWCAMELVAYLAGESHSDSPKCVDPALRRFVIGLNDHLPDDLRQQLRPYLARMIGAAEDGRAQERLYMMIDWALRVVAPEAVELRGHRDWADELRDVEPVVDMATARVAERVARDAAERVARDADAATNATLHHPAKPIVTAYNAVTSAARGDAYNAGTDVSLAAAYTASGAASERAMWVKLLPSALDLLDRMLGDEIVELPPEKKAKAEALAH